MRQPALARSSARFTGVIDTLSAGYGVVNRHPWLLLMPILLDLFLWLGPQFSMGRLVGRTIGRAVPFGPGGAAAGAFSRAQLAELVQAFEGFNLLSALAPSMLFSAQVPSMVGLPSFVATLGVRDPLRSVPIETWAGALAMLAGAGLLGLLLGSLYYAVLAQEVRDGGLSAVGLPVQAVRSWLRVLQYLLLVLGVAVLFGLPIGLLEAGAVLISPTLGLLIMSAVTVAVIWAGIYLYFVPEAIFLSQVGPLQAIRNSVAVVRLSPWATWGIIGLTALVLLGMAQVWELAARQLAEPWGVALAVLGNAYIVSGLIAASMRFYRERIEYLRPGGQQTGSTLTTDN